MESEGLSEAIKSTSLVHTLCSSSSRSWFLIKKLGIVLLFLQRHSGNIENELMRVEQRYWEEQNQTRKRELL